MSIIDNITIIATLRWNPDVKKNLLTGKVIVTTAFFINKLAGNKEEKISCNKATIVVTLYAFRGVLFSE